MFSQLWGPKIEKVKLEKQSLCYFMSGGKDPRRKIQNEGNKTTSVKPFKEETEVLYHKDSSKTCI